MHKKVNIYLLEWEWYKLYALYATVYDTHRGIILQTDLLSQGDIR